jgi:hypothetical protein
MRPTKHRILGAVTLLLLSLNLQAAEITREQAGELMQECQAQRQQKIAPLKAEAIEDCVTRQRKERGYCERFNKNFGERTPAGNRRGMFWDLPACQQAVSAQQYFKKYPGRKVYSTP